MKQPGYKVIVIGSSAGGLHALSDLFSALNHPLNCPVLTVQHLHPSESSLFSQVLNTVTAITIKEAEDKELLNPGDVYVAPPDYHMLVDQNGTISLSVEEKVNHSRPSIDVLFESAVFAFGAGVIGVILTGASRDGARGMSLIQKAGGVTIVQDPETAFCAVMPRAVISTVHADYILPVLHIASTLTQLAGLSHG